MRPNFSRVILAVCVVMLPFFTQAGEITQVRTFKVNTVSDGVDADPGDGICNTHVNPNYPHRCTLRAAVMEGNAAGDGWVVNVELVPGQTYSLTIPGPMEQEGRTGDLDVLRPMRIGVPDSASSMATIDAKGGDRIFDFSHTPGASGLYGLRLVGAIVKGEYECGAAIFSTAETLFAERLLVEKASKISFSGGMICVKAGSFALLKSSVQDNGTFGQAGEIDIFASAILASGVGTSVSIEKSTIAFNAGYGIRMTQRAVLLVSSSTISSNGWPGVSLFGADAVISSSSLVDNMSSASMVGGQLVAAGLPDFPIYVSLRNSSFSSRKGRAACDISGPDHVALVTSYNIYDDASCLGDTFIDDSLHNTDAMLSSLGYHGGPTPTHVPMPGSPAIDRAPSTVCTQEGTDQRGMKRPVPYAANSPSRCDTGAVELGSLFPADPPPDDPPPNENFPAVFSDGFDGGS